MVNKESNRKFLLIDIGNSTVKWAISTGLDVSILQRQPYAQDVSENFFVDLWSGIEPPDRVLVTCVGNEKIRMALEAACVSLWGLIIEKVISSPKWRSLINSYTISSDLGSDRWCAMVAAHQLSHSGYIVVDCGTAVTIDVVDYTGQHLGGYILPGLELMRKSLGLHTAQVKVGEANNETDSLQPGISTAACVKAGILLAAVKSIESVVERQVKDNRDVRCYLTGGDADPVAALLSVKYDIIPDLVLRGLIYLAEK